MLSHFKYFIASTASIPKNSKYTLFPKLYGRSQKTATHLYSNSSYKSLDSDIMDINVDKTMNENDEFASNYSYEPERQTIASMDTNNAGMAPIDINPWADEELEKNGTVDMEYLDKEKEEIHYPEPPKERSGCYEFEGIKIWLPKKMLTPATYRYRLTEEEEQTLPDDIRICKFEHFKPTS